MISVYEPANGFSHTINFEPNSPLQKTIINTEDGTIKTLKNEDGNLSNVIIKVNGVTQYNGDASSFTSFPVVNSDRITLQITRVNDSNSCTIQLIAINHNQSDKDYSVFPIATNSSEWLFVFNAYSQTIEMVSTITDTIHTTYDIAAINALAFPRCGAYNSTDNHYYILCTAATVNSISYWGRINMDSSSGNYLDFESLDGTTNALTTISLAGGYGGLTGIMLYNSENDAFILNFNNANPVIAIMKHNYVSSSYINSTFTSTSYFARLASFCPINNSVYTFFSIRFSFEDYPSVKGDRIGSSLYNNTFVLEDTLYHIRNSTGGTYYTSDLDYNQLTVTSSGSAVHSNGIGLMNVILVTDDYVVCCISTSNGGGLGNNSGGFNIFSRATNTFICSIGIAVSLQPDTTGYCLAGFCFTGNKIYARTQKRASPAATIGGNSLFVLDLDTLNLASSRVLSVAETGFTIISIGEAQLGAYNTDSIQIMSLNK